MDNKLEIKRVNNGFVLIGEFLEDGKVSEFIIQDREKEIDSMIDLLVTVKEYFGNFYSKDNEENLVIGIDGGVVGELGFN